MSFSSYLVAPGGSPSLSQLSLAVFNRWMTSACSLEYPTEVEAFILAGLPPFSIAVSTDLNKVFKRAGKREKEIKKKSKSLFFLRRLEQQRNSARAKSGRNQLYACRFYNNHPFIYQIRKCLTQHNKSISSDQKKKKLRIVAEQFQ